MNRRFHSLLILFLIVFFHANSQNFKQTPKEHSKVYFNNLVTLESATTIINYKQAFNGSGVGVGDLNNDGLPDLVFTAAYGEDSFYINQGNLVFENGGALSSKNTFSTGVSLIDINNDGYLDIYICKAGPYLEEKRKNLLYINQEGKRFIEEGEKRGVADKGFSIHSSFFDFDSDGDLDLYVVNQLDPADRRQYENTVDRIYINDGSGVFSLFPGLPIEDKSFGLGIAVADFNWNFKPSLYISNDFLERDYFFQWGDEGFTESLKSNFQRITQNSMGVDAQDINNDLLLDIVTLDMTAEHNYRNKATMASMNPKRFHAMVARGEYYQYMYNGIQLNLGNNQFRDIGFMAGIAKTDWSWAPLIADFDLDGLKDLYITNGIYLNNHKDNKKTALYKDGMTQEELHIAFIEKHPPEPISNYYYKNIDGYHFEDYTTESNLEIPSFSNGAAYADLDLDGDLDLVVNNINEEAFVFENRIAGTNYIQISLNGSGKNTGGVGSKVLVYANGTQQLQEFYPSRGYMSSMHGPLVFGLGDNAIVDSILVIWPDQKMQKLEKVKPNQSLTFSYKDAKDIYAPIAKSPALFSVDYLPVFKHEENDYDDFKEEILLPYKLSTLGPKMAVGDINNDGRDDIVIGGASGQRTGVLIQNNKGSFTVLQLAVLNADSLREDLDIEIIDYNQDGLNDIYIGSGGNEFSDGSAMLEDRLYLNKGGNAFEKLNIPFNGGSNSTVLFVDDLFKDKTSYCIVGNRLKAQQYPFPASSAIYKIENDAFTNMSEELIPEFEEIGLVTDIDLFDINNDGLKDLIITREWQSIQIFINTGSNFELTVNPILEENTGWWNCIIPGDFDNDGDIDFIAGNNGENSKYKASVDEPFPVYASDFDGSGDIDIVLGYYDEGELYPVRGLQCSSQEVPTVKEEFKDYHHFGMAKLEDIYGESLQKSLNYAVSNFASCIFINDGKGVFSISKLPIECQFSSVNAGVKIDYNKDGNLDLILAGNLLNFEVETPRNDASIGVLLKGKGDGSFKAIPLLQSGIQLKNEIKDMQLITIQDKVYVVCATNNDFIQLIHLND